MKVWAVVAALSFALVLPVAAPAALAAPVDANSPLAVKREFLSAFREQIKGNPAAAPQLLRAFWKDSPNQKVNFLLTTSIEASQILWRLDRAQAGAALDLLELTIGRFPNARIRYLAVEAQAEILRKSDRLDEAAQLLELTWPRVQSRNLDPVMTPILFEWVEVLRAQKRPDQAIELLEEALKTTPPLANLMNFYRVMVDAQTEAGHGDEALRWAGLFFRVAPFENDDIARATTLVTRGWLQANDMEKPALFAAAQSEVEAPNPLQEVAAPTLPAPVKLALQQRLQSEANNEASPSRVAMYLILGEHRLAMLEAREILLRDPTGAAGTAEVARVFKAVDGDVARANAFLQFYRTGQGENPLNEFLREVTP